MNRPGAIHCGGVGYGNIPVQRAFALVGDVFHAAPVDENPTGLQIIQVAALVMENALQFGGTQIVDDVNGTPCQAEDVVPSS